MARHPEHTARSGSSQPQVVPYCKRPSRYGRWRAASLAGVYVLFAVHIAHWKIAGKTLAPLELHEVMYTLELGVLTAGFLFMVAAFLSAAIFGRFFCSWGCHILALEDLCNWLLGKIGIRPKPVRSRVLLLVPLGAILYMFVWPQIARVMRGDPFPTIHIETDAQGWASFVTTDFWRNLPGPGIIILTFAVCGFVIIYLLGSRSFCTYACPYGVVFALADRVSPGRIRVKGDCTQLSHCTAACPSHVRVHEEIDKFGKVVDSSCLKCLVCVSACPNHALGFGFTRPSLLRSFSRTGRRRLRYDFTLGEDVLMAVVFVATLVIFRGLYDLVPFIMTLGLGGIFAYLAVLSLRLVDRPNVRLNYFQLKLAGRLTSWGRGFAALMTVLAVFTAHSAFIRYHESQGKRAFERMRWYLDEQQADPPPALLSKARGHFKMVERWSLFKSPVLDDRLASVYLFDDPPTGAEPYFRRILSNRPDHHEARLRFAQMLVGSGRIDEARAQLLLVASAEIPSLGGSRKITHFRASAHEMLGTIHIALGDRDAAIAEYQAALAEQPEHAGPHLALAELFANDGNLNEAVVHLRAAVAIIPDSAEAHYNLARAYEHLGRTEDAAEHFRRAAQLDPQYAPLVPDAPDGDGRGQ